MLGYAANASGQLTQISVTVDDDRRVPRQNGSFLFWPERGSKEDGRRTFSPTAVELPEWRLKIHQRDQHPEDAGSQNVRGNQAEDLLLDHTGK